MSNAVVITIQDFKEDDIDFDIYRDDDGDYAIIFQSGGIRTEIKLQEFQYRIFKDKVNEGK